MSEMPARDCSEIQLPAPGTTSPPPRAPPHCAFSATESFLVVGGLVAGNPGGLRRAMTYLWEPWVYWAYGAGFDRQTEKHVPEAGLQLRESRFVADELIKLLGAVA
jgi:hypothetical protein